MSWKEAHIVSVCSLEPAMSESSTLRPSMPMPPGGHHCLARPVGAQSQGDPVDIEVDDLMLRPVALGEGLIFRRAAR